MANKTIELHVFSAQPNGYRRAGFTLQQGANNLEVDETQWEALAQDPRLKVEVRSSLETTKAQTDLDAGSMDSDLVLDLHNAPEELAHIIAAIHLLNGKSTLTKKPTVDELAFEVDGVEGELKPTATERDAAWEWYKANTTSVEQ
ncbi:HI1506-related protein [Pseudoalteromonas xiamenensis]